MIVEIEVPPHQEKRVVEVLIKAADFCSARANTFNDGDPRNLAQKNSWFAIGNSFRNAAHNLQMPGIAKEKAAELIRHKAALVHEAARVLEALRGDLIETFEIGVKSGLTQTEIGKNAQYSRKHVGEIISRKLRGTL